MRDTNVVWFSVACLSLVSILALVWGIDAKNGVVDVSDEFQLFREETAGSISGLGSDIGGISDTLAGIVSKDYVPSKLHQEDIAALRSEVYVLSADIANFHLDADRILSNSGSIAGILVELAEIEDKISGLGKSIRQLEYEVAYLGDYYVYKDYDSSWLSYLGVQDWDAVELSDGVLSGYGFHTDSAVAGSWVGITFPYAYRLVEWSYYWGGSSGGAVWDIQYSDNNVNWTTVYVGLDCGGTKGWKVAEWYDVGEHRYWRSYKTSSAVGGGYHTELAVRVK